MDILTVIRCALTRILGEIFFRKYVDSDQVICNNFNFTLTLIIIAFICIVIVIMFAVLCICCSCKKNSIDYQNPNSIKVVSNGQLQSETECQNESIDNSNWEEIKVDINVEIIFDNIYPNLDAISLDSNDQPHSETDCQTESIHNSNTEEIQVDINVQSQSETAPDVPTVSMLGARWEEWEVILENNKTRMAELDNDMVTSQMGEDSSE